MSDHNTTPGAPETEALDRSPLFDHEPVAGATRLGGVLRGAILGCSCLSARDYRAAGFSGGPKGYIEHLLALGLDEMPTPTEAATRDAAQRAAGAETAASDGMENVDLIVYGTWRGLAESLRTLGTEETYEVARQHWERITSDAARTALREAAVRPYPEGTKLVVVSEGAWEEARLAECTIPELQDALANADGYAKGLPDRVADFLLGYSGDGDESDPQSWQSGHNYAMREAARMIRERWFDLPKPELPTPEDFGGAKC